MDAESIADTLLSTAQEWGLLLSDLVAQGYDGASVMSSDKNGVQAKIKEKYPNATYVHCRSHVLNLAVSSGCNSVPPIRNLFDNVQKLTWFLGGSAKRKEIFLERASSHRDDQQLLVNLLAEADNTEGCQYQLKLLKRVERREQCLSFVLLVGQPELILFQPY